MVAFSMIIISTILHLLTGTSAQPTTTLDCWMLEVRQPFIECAQNGCGYNIVSGEGCWPLTSEIVRNCTCFAISPATATAGCEPDSKNVGVSVLRMRYMGASDAASIQVYSSSDTTTGDVICEYDSVISGETIRCDAQANDALALIKFPDTTYFKITHEDQTICYPEFHTKTDDAFWKKDSKFLGSYSDVCDELLGTGWSDSVYANETGFMQCWDGRVPCECGTEPSTTGTPLDIQAGDCLCDYLTASSVPDSNGLGGYGDCACDKDWGLMEMRLQYIGTKDVSLWQAFKESAVVCNFTDIKPNDTVVCNVQSTGVYDRFDKNTVFEITHTDGTTCAPVFHTSCSSDIVGGTSTECPEIKCTAWRDGNPVQNSCDNGQVWCDCCYKYGVESCLMYPEECCFVGAECTTMLDTTVCDGDTTEAPLTSAAPDATTTAGAISTAGGTSAGTSATASVTTGGTGATQGTAPDTDTDTTVGGTETTGTEATDGATQADTTDDGSTATQAGTSDSGTTAADATAADTTAASTTSTQGAGGDDDQNDDEDDDRSVSMRVSPMMVILASVLGIGFVN